MVEWSIGNREGTEGNIAGIKFDSRFMSTLVTILLIVAGIVCFAAMSAAFISVYEKYTSREPNRFLVVIVNITILLVAYFVVVGPLLGN